MARGDIALKRTTSRAGSDLLLRRVYGEFLEMPGLRLTCPQAQRLWGLDEATCLELLESLVEAKFLCRRDGGMYTRLTDGREAGPQFAIPRAASEGPVNDDGWDPPHELEELSPRPADGVDIDAETSIDLDLAARSLVNVMVTAKDAPRRAALARTIHARSARCERPFVAMCGGPLPAGPGAASTCDVDDGFVRAAGGTLFIDHIGQLPPHAQAVLVWRLTDQAHRAGERTTPPSHRVRVIAGSDRSLGGDLSAGAFSEELFYRLNVIHIDQPRAHEPGATRI